MKTVSDIYTERRERFQQEAEELKKYSRWFPWGRAFTFLVGVSLMILGWSGSAPRWLAWPGVALLVLFFIVVFLHRRIQREIVDTALLEEVNQRGIDRLGSAWRTFAQDGSAFLSKEHPYAQDIDVLGQGSLFQRINATATQFGEETLAQWLLERAPKEEIERRQEIVADLKDRLEFRQHLEKEGRRIDVDPQWSGPEPFLAWAESPALLWNRKGWVWLFRLMPLFTIGALLVFQIKPISFWWWFAPFALQVVILGYFIRRVQPILGSVAYREKAFSLYSALFNHIDSELTDSKQPLAGIQKKLRGQGAAPQKEMRVLQRIVDMIEFRQSPMFHLPLNFLLFWDLHCLLFLEKWKARTGQHLRGWFAQLGEVEALSSLATAASENPVGSFPEILESSEPLVFEAEELGHPLLPVDGRVYNDVTLSPECPFMLITGSNMSGKSTLLRSIALNACLAFAGGEVNARNLRLSHVQVATSMRISDSLEHGISYFLAELHRIKRVLDHLDDGIPLLYLLDEILHGTNTFERRKAAMGVITLLQQGNAIGAVTTHDLDLAEDCKRFGSQVHFTYFTDHIREQQMVFDYKLQEGICPTTNALRLMRIVGIPLPEEDDPNGLTL